MAKVFMLSIDVIPPGGGPGFVTHVFWGETEAEARETYAKHAAGCEFLTPAIAEGRIEEELDEVNEDLRPYFDEDDDDEEDDVDGREEDEEEEDEEETT